MKSQSWQYLRSLKSPTRSYTLRGKEEVPAGQRALIPQQRIAHRWKEVDAVLNAGKVIGLLRQEDGSPSRSTSTLENANSAPRSWQALEQPRQPGRRERVVGVQDIDVVAL